MPSPSVRVKRNVSAVANPFRLTRTLGNFNLLLGFTGKNFVSRAAELWILRATRRAVNIASGLRVTDSTHTLFQFLHRLLLGAALGPSTDNSSIRKWLRCQKLACHSIPRLQDRRQRQQHNRRQTDRDPVRKWDVSDHHIG